MGTGSFDFHETNQLHVGCTSTTKHDATLHHMEVNRIRIYFVMINSGSAHQYLTTIKPLQQSIYTARKCKYKTT